MRWVDDKRRDEKDSAVAWETPAEFLHTAFSHLLEEPDSSAPFTQLLERIEGHVGASASAILILPDAGGPPAPWAWTPGTDYVRISRLLDNSLDGLHPFLNNGSAPMRLLPDQEQPQSKIIVVGLDLGTQRIGLLALKTQGSPQALSENITLLHKLGGGIATMIHSAQRARTSRTEALREERAAIARDLHDSLAQSLSYGKIQVSRLQSLLREDRQDPSSWRAVEMDSVVQELRSNLNMTYRQLRDLITTCRLTMNGRNLDQALEDSMEEFEKRSGIAFELDNRLVGVKLKAEEEMQVLHIIREALSNIVRHSHAKHAAVRLFGAANGRFNITISDDGIGIDLNHMSDPHHGLMIMQERTHSLGGDISLENNGSGGTCVRVDFTPKSIADEQASRARVRYDDPTKPSNRIDHR